MVCNKAKKGEYSLQKWRSPACRAPCSGTAVVLGSAYSACIVPQLVKTVGRRLPPLRSHCTGSLPPAEPPTPDVLCKGTVYQGHDWGLSGPIATSRQRCPCWLVGLRQATGETVGSFLAVFSEHLTLACLATVVLNPTCS